MILKSLSLFYQKLVLQKAVPALSNKMQNLTKELCKLLKHSLKWDNSLDFILSRSVSNYLCVLYVVIKRVQYYYNRKKQGSAYALWTTDECIV